jgi:putative oxidoreductase
MKRKTIISGISMLLLSVFLYTGVEKWAHFTLFKEEVAQLPLPAQIRWFVVVFLPVIEVTAAILLGIPRWRQKGLVLGIALTGAFSIYLALLSHADGSLPCSCGGIFEALGRTTHLVVNLALLAAGCIGLMLRNKEFTTGSLVNKT